MEEKEMKRIAFLSIQDYLEKAKEECGKVEDLKKMFKQKIEDLLSEISQEMIRQGMKDKELI